MKIAKILVPVDFSEFSEKAVAYALYLAEKYAAHITLVHAMVLHYEDIEEAQHFKEYEKLVEFQENRTLQQFQKLALPLVHYVRVDLVTACDLGHRVSLLYRF